METAGSNMGEGVMDIFSNFLTTDIQVEEGELCTPERFIEGPSPLKTLYKKVQT